MENLELLKRVRIFQGLSTEQLSKFAAFAIEEGYPPEEVIIEEGEEGRAIFIIRKGTVKVCKVDGDFVTELVRLSTGEAFGEMSFIENDKTSAQVSACDDVDVLALEKKPFLDLMQRDVNIAAKVYQNFTRVLSERLRKTSSELGALRAATAK